MMHKKVCMLGSSAVGKTSLVNRFVQSAFSDKYLTTLGVRIDKKQIAMGGRDLTLVLWDMQGDDETHKVRLSHLRGAAGYLLVADGTRRETFDTACAIQERAEATIGKVPFLLLVNKADLAEQWQVDDRALQGLADRGWIVSRTSARLGQGVEEAFLTLAHHMLKA
jgi:small GTP-binding protein